MQKPSFDDLSAISSGGKAAHWRLATSHKLESLMEQRYWNRFAQHGIRPGDIVHAVCNLNDTDHPLNFEPASFIVLRVVNSTRIGSVEVGCISSPRIMELSNGTEDEDAA
jgi:hypothetical protein